jgi:hypothetical protein
MSFSKIVRKILNIGVGAPWRARRLLKVVGEAVSYLCLLSSWDLGNFSCFLLLVGLIIVCLGWVRAGFRMSVGYNSNGVFLMGFNLIKIIWNGPFFRVFCYFGRVDTFLFAFFTGCIWG